MEAPNYLRPSATVPQQTTWMIIASWLAGVALVWMVSPFPFLPQPGEVQTALHDLWFYQDLGIALLASVKLNFEAIAVATIISLLISYAGTIAVFAPVAALVGKLRFLSFYGLQFAFTLMFGGGQALKVSVLVFMVTVFFVVAMSDVIAQIPQEQYDLAHTLRMGDWETLWEVVVLGQLDQAFIVLRQTAAMSWMMVGVAESMSMSGGGIGTLLATSNRHFHMSEVMALQLVVLALGLLQDWLIGWARLECCPWMAR